MNLQEEYPKMWKAIEDEEIPEKDIDSFLLIFVLKLCQEIKEGKRDELDIGDAFGIGIQHAKTVGYSLSPEVEELLFDLGNYKSDPSETGDYIESDNIQEVESRTKRILNNLKR